MVKSVEDSWSGWMWGHWVFHRLKTGKLSLESERENDFINCMGELMKFRKYEAHGPRWSSDKTVLTVNKHICPKAWLNHIIEKKISFFNIKWSILCYKLHPRMICAIFGWNSQFWYVNHSEMSDQSDCCWWNHHCSNSILSHTLKLLANVRRSKVTKYEACWWIQMFWIPIFSLKLLTDA